MSGNLMSLGNANLRPLIKYTRVTMSTIIMLIRNVHGTLPTSAFTKIRIVRWAPGNLPSNLAQLPRKQRAAKNATSFYYYCDCRAWRLFLAWETSWIDTGDQKMLFMHISVVIYLEII